MPADIRAFFGGKSGQQPTPKSTASPKRSTPASKSSKSSKKKVVESDSDDDIAETKQSTPKKTVASRPKPPTPKVTATTATEYFSNSAKPKKLEPSKSKTSASSVPKVEIEKSSKSTNGTANGKSKAYSKPKQHDDDLEDMDNDDDLFAADYKKGARTGDDYEESDLEHEDVKPTRKLRTARGNTSKKEDSDVDMKDLDSDDDFVVPDDDYVKPSKAKRTSRTKKRKSDEMDEDEDESPKKSRARPAKSTKATPTKASKAKKSAAKNEDPEIRKILDSIPTVKPPTPPPKQDNPKWNPAMYKGNTTTPVAAGSKEIPEGADNCLAGLTFVFTGVLESLEREEAKSLVKRYGGKVMSAPSKNTKYVVLGADAGPSKLRKIQEAGLTTINEDGLFALIRTLPANGGSGNAAKAAQDRADKEVAVAREAAEEIEKRLKTEEKEHKKQQAAMAKASGTTAKAPVAPKISEDNKLWTVKYAPTQASQIVGNKGQVEKLQNWLKNFRRNAKLNFKLAGKDGSGTYRAVMIHGPPGIGKTTAAHLVAKLEGYDIVESNASDTRSKKMVEDGLRGVLGGTSLLGYFSGDGKSVQDTKRKLVLIMDEVDGMSAGDRGGVGAMAAICKKTAIPIILICNDRKLPKMKPFDFVTFDLPFRRPTTEQIRARMMTIAFREKLKMTPQVLNALIEGTGADIRQTVNMLSTAKVDESEMDFNKGKEMSKAWEKHIVLKPWDITGKILGAGMFAPNSKSTLNEKIELYFNDHEFSFLMLQENYLGTQPMKLNGITDHKDRAFKQLELVSEAADSISDGDLVDRMIHGSQQQWSLMPTHAVFSFVRPASLVAGSLAYGQTRFTSWLGNNSKLGKLTRYVKEIQGHMRLRASGDRHEIRQQYVPMLWNSLPKRLQVEGKEAVPAVIDLMDSYFLTKDDFDAIQELGVGPMDESNLKIETQAKATFTRLYNQQSHPLPFMKASQVVAPKAAAKEKPDLEEALEDSDEGEAVDEAKQEDEDVDITKDKYIKAPKKKAAPKAKSKKRAADSDPEDSEPKKAKAASSKAKGKGKK